MIVFEDGNEFYSRLAQKFIFNFIDIYEDEIKEEFIEEDDIRKFFPKMTFLENREKCRITFFKLKQWAIDDIYHQIGSLEKVCIVKMFEKIDEIRNELGINEFVEIYFGKTKTEFVDEMRKEMSDAIEEFKEEMDSEEELLELIVSSGAFIDCLFCDLDEFIFTDIYIKEKKENLGFIDEYYYDILPQDIVERIKKDKENNGNNVDYFIDSFKKIIEKSLYRLSNIENFKEKDFQLLFELFSRSYNCTSLDIKTVIRETSIGDGITDFIIKFPYYNNVLFEIKMDEKSKVKKSIENQIPEYLERLDCKYAVIIVFSNCDKNAVFYKNISESISKKIEGNISSVLINYSKKETPSKLLKKY